MNSQKNCEHNIFLSVRLLNYYFQQRYERTTGFLVTLVHVELL